MSRHPSVQARLEKVRPPRVRLSYDVQVGDAIERKELPFVVGVIGDFSGAGSGGNDAARSRLKERKFVQVDLDNFDDVLHGVAPTARFRVPNRLAPGGGEFAVELGFQRLEDFRPEAVVQQVEPLRQLLAARTRLSDLRNKMAGNDRLEDLLAELLRDRSAMAALGHEAGPNTDPDTTPDGAGR
ncbi:type VI secretion system contractile sheath small subunit [Rubrivivax gelatinosus]|nr:type VI secretion system contractile sheath small subunit [Rubrivivax gelatinosus]